MSERQQELFNLMTQEHGLTLLQSEMHDIEHVVLKMSQWRPVDMPPQTDTPEVKIPVLLSDSILGVIAGYYRDGEFWSESSNPHRTTITHWQPRPEPSKQ